MLREQTAGEKRAPGQRGSGKWALRDRQQSSWEAESYRRKKSILGENSLAKAQRYEKVEFICTSMSSSGRLEWRDILWQWQYGSYVIYRVTRENLDNDHEFSILPYQTFLLLPLPTSHHMICRISFGSQYVWFQNRVCGSDCTHFSTELIKDLALSSQEGENILLSLYISKVLY